MAPGAALVSAPFGGSTCTFTLPIAPGAQPLDAGACLERTEWRVLNRVATFNRSGDLQTVDPLVTALEGLGLLSKQRIVIDDQAYDVDFVSGNRRVIIEVKRTGGGLRDVHAAALRVAMHARTLGAERGIVLLCASRVSAAGLREEWHKLLKVFAPDLASRLGLVAILDDNVVIEPDDPLLRDIAEAAANAGGRSAPTLRGNRSFEVMRVLLSRWLLHRGRIAVGELQRQTGLSHPSVSKALVALGPAVERRRDRSVALRAFPSEAWAQLVALAPKVRQTSAFVDESGRGGDPQRLLDRLRRAPPPGVAVAGVVAARHWHSGLDLEGIPRLDLSVHAPDGGMDTAFVARLDPALVLAPPGTPPLLVLHAVPRAESLFTPGDATLPWADPVEALLDLYELRLIEQADELVRALRRTP
jgi:DNA-binding transcriptional ArsR family regulator